MSVVLHQILLPILWYIIYLSNPTSDLILISIHSILPLLPLSLPPPHTHSLLPGPPSLPPSLTPIPSLPLSLPLSHTLISLPTSAPEKRGRIQKEDLSAFISRTCRSFGVLLTLLERDLLKGVIQAYRKLRYITSSFIRSL